MKYLHWRGIAELSFARAAASYAYFDAKRRLNRFDPYFEWRDSTDQHLSNSRQATAAYVELIGIKLLVIHFMFIS